MTGKNAFWMMACGALALGTACPAAAREPVDYVNTGIGSISHMLVPTFRTVQRPHALFRFNAPYGDFTQDAVADCWIQYPAHRQSPVFSFHPYSGDAKGATGPWRSSWDQPHAAPYRYDVRLDAYDVTLAVAPGERSALFAFAFERDEAHAVQFGLRNGKEGSYAWDGRVLRGVDVCAARAGFPVRVYLHAEFDAAPSDVRKAGARTVLLFGAKAETVRMRVGISYISAEQAERNLRAEIADFDLDRLAAGARDAWNRTLSQVEVEGGTEDDRREGARRRRRALLHGRLDVGHFPRRAPAHDDTPAARGIRQARELRAHGRTEPRALDARLPHPRRRRALHDQPPPVRDVPRRLAQGHPRLRREEGV